MKKISSLLIVLSFLTTLKAQNIVNLGKNINLPNVEELLPVVSADGNEIYYIRDMFRKSVNRNVQSLWYSSKDSTGNWKNATYLKKPFNVETTSSAVFYVSPDNNTILIRGYFKDGYRISTVEGFSFINRSKDGFANPVGIELAGFNEMSKGKYSGATLLPDGKGLILSFSEISGDAKSDLYFSKRNEDGSFKRPVKITNLTTDEFSEFGTFVAADNKTLYFASDRTGTMGSSDIWKTTRLDDTWLNWSTPENLGAPINTAEWDAYLYLDAKGDYAYMIKAGDVVKIELEKKNQPKPVVLVKGRVFDKKTNQPIAASIFYENLADASNEGIAISDSAQGMYQIALPYGKNYGFSANAKNYFSISENLDLTAISEYKVIERDLYLAPFEVKQAIRINNIFFEFGKADLKSESFAELNRLVEYLAKNPSVTISIGGHTDNVGDDAMNLALSEARAKSVVNYLISKGINANRLSSKGFGESAPLMTNDSEEGRKFNRRVEFTIESF